MVLGDGLSDGDVSPVYDALDQFGTALDHLVKVVDDGGLGGFDPMEMVGFLQSLERVRSRMSVLDHRALADCEAAGVAAELAQPSLARVLVSALRLSPGEAAGGSPPRRLVCLG